MSRSAERRLEVFVDVEEEEALQVPVSCTGLDVCLKTTRKEMRTTIVSVVTPCSTDLRSWSSNVNECADDPAGVQAALSAAMDGSDSDGADISTHPGGWGRGRCETMSR